MGFFYFVFGAMMGSVANALVYRLPRNISWIRGHSMCTHCTHELRGVDLIPLASFIFLRGRCRYCNVAIGVRYFLLELFLAVGFVFFSSNPMLCAILWVTTVVAVMDWETKLVSEFMVLIWCILIGIFQFHMFGIHTLFGVVVAISVIGGLWALSKGRAMGFGDVEIAFAIGLWLGWPNVLVALWIAFVSGAIVGVVMLFVGKNKRTLKTEIAFGPFLVLGSWIAFLFGTQVLRYLYV